MNLKKRKIPKKKKLPSEFKEILEKGGAVIVEVSPAEEILLDAESQIAKTEVKMLKEIRKMARKRRVDYVV